MEKKITALLVSGMLLSLLVFSLAKAQTEAADLSRLPLAQSTSSSPQSACPPDAYEPNGDLASAATIPLGVATSAYICPDLDQDFFVFAVDEVSEIEVRLSALPADYQLALFNPGGAIVARAGDGGTTPRTIRYRTTTNGDYRIRVMAGSRGDAAESYDLSVDLTDLPPVTVYAADDAYISEEFPDNNYGEELRISVSEDEFGQRNRGLLRFDLSRVPRTEIASATLRMALIDDASSYPLNVGLYLATRAWEEDSVTWDNQPSAAIRVAETGVGGSSSRYYEWDMTGLVRTWLVGIPNHGIVLKTEADNGSRSFVSRVRSGMFIRPGAGSSRTPRLIIHFVEESEGTPGSIRGFVYHDFNGDGRREPGERGIGDVRVELFREDVGWGNQMTTSNGAYHFTDLPAGEYEVQVRPSSLTISWELISSETLSMSLGPGVHRSGRNFRVDNRPPEPRPLPEPTLDLEAVDMEFIQVLSGVRLIAGKPTLARLYVGTEEIANDVSANLYHNGHFDDPLAPMAPADIMPSIERNPRDDDNVVANMDRTINFLLPSSWTTPGYHDFHLMLNEDEWWRECRGCYDSENQKVRNSVRFRETNDHKVIMAHLDIDGVTPTIALADVYDHLQKTYPISDVDTISATIPLDGIDLTVPVTIGCGTGWTDLLDDLAESDVFTDLGDGVQPRYIYGMIDDSVPHEAIIDGVLGSIGGCGYRPGRQAAGIVNPFFFGTSEGSRIMAHETGHNYGLQHTCSDRVPLEPDCIHHHTDGKIGDYGLDLSDPANPDFLDPNSFYDIMTYNGPRMWISDLTFRALSYEFSAAAVGDKASVAIAAEREYVVVTGHLLNGVLTMPRPCYRLKFPSGSHDGPGAGPYSIELQDVNGKALFTRRFETAGDSISSEGTGFFREILPWMPATRRIAIKDGNRVLHILRVSPNTPKVKLRSPNGNGHWLANGRYTISWTGSDADGDPLRYALQYSPDGGQTWRAIITDLTKTKYTVSAKTLPGGEEALIRVTASDGINTAQDQSDDYFTVEGKPSSVEIISPREGSVNTPGMPVILRGMATDLEDGPIKDDARFRWTSSLEGELGIGRSLYFDDLRPGRHIITLSVFDNDGFTSSKSIESLIAHQIHLPVVAQ